MSTSSQWSDQNMTYADTYCCHVQKHNTLRPACCHTQAHTCTLRPAVTCRNIIPLGLHTVIRRYILGHTYLEACCHMQKHVHVRTYLEACMLPLHRHIHTLRPAWLAFDEGMTEDTNIPHPNSFPVRDER